MTNQNDLQKKELLDFLGTMTQIQDADKAVVVVANKVEKREIVIGDSISILGLLEVVKSKAIKQIHEAEENDRRAKEESK